MVGSLNIPAALRENVQMSPTFLVVSGQTSAGKMFKLRGEMVIGRTTTADIYLDDDGVSRRHAKVVVRSDGTVQVSDLQSTNGTYHNGERIASHFLRDGDTIQIGSTTILKFSYRDALEEELQKNLYDSATRDGLTKTYNKKYFGEALKREFAHAQRQATPLTLVMFDIDHFKHINDRHGHTVGDFVLAKLASKVIECIRAEDTLARYGGEEFALLLRDAPEKQGFACAERIRRVIEITDFSTNGTRIPVTSSFGVATFTGAEFTVPEQLIETADQFLYKAKRAGRNRVEARMTAGLLGQLVGRQGAVLVALAEERLQGEAAAVQRVGHRDADEAIVPGLPDVLRGLRGVAGVREHQAEAVCVLRDPAHRRAGVDAGGVPALVEGAAGLAVDQVSGGAELVLGVPGVG